MYHQFLLTFTQLELLTASPRAREGELKRIQKELCAILQWVLETSATTQSPLDTIRESLDRLRTAPSAIDLDGRLDLTSLSRLSEAFSHLFYGNPANERVVGPLLRHYFQAESMQRLLEFVDRDEEENIDNPIITALDAIDARLKSGQPATLDEHELSMLGGFCRILSRAPAPSAHIAAYVGYFWLTGKWLKV